MSATARREHLGHEAGLRAIGSMLAQERSTKLLLLLSAAIGMAFCLAQFDLGFLAGTAPFWRDPAGIVGGGWADMATALSGYDYFVQDSWRLPLFQVERLGAPGGTNVIFTDSTQLVALAGRLLFRSSGRVVNLFGAWTALCFTGSAVAMTLLVTRLGARSLAASAVAAVFGLCMPALLARWGHVSLMAQCEVTFALALYFEAKAAPKPLAPLLWAFPLALAALWTHAYLFAMVASLIVASLAQAVADGRLSRIRGAVLAAALAGVLAAAIAISGFASRPHSLDASGFGFYSANLLSAILPQRSGLLPLRDGALVDATGGQYEGFCYLGAGGLLLLAMTHRDLARRLRPSLRPHGWLWLVIGGCTLFAMSNVVYFGGIPIVDIPLPADALALASVFRASGRFIWPALYLVTALAIAARPKFTLALLLAAGLQWVDTAPLRLAAAASTQRGAGAPIDIAAWEGAIAAHDFVRVVPPLGCIAHLPHPLGRVMMQIQLIAGRENIPTNQVYAANSRPDCDPAPAGPGAMTVYLPGLVPPPPGAPCTASPEMTVCSTRLSAADRAGLLLPPGRQDNAWQ